MHPANPFPPVGTSPAAAVTALARALTARGLTTIYTAADARVGLVSVTAALTVWTDGRQIWCIHAGQRHTWPAADIGGTAAAIAALARPADNP